MNNKYYSIIMSKDQEGVESPYIEIRKNKEQ
jgi:hypothetical protein